VTTDVLDLLMTLEVLTLAGVRFKIQFSVNNFKTRTILQFFQKYNE